MGHLCKLKLCDLCGNFALFLAICLADHDHACGGSADNGRGLPVHYTSPHSSILILLGGKCNPQQCSQPKQVAIFLHPSLVTFGIVVFLNLHTKQLPSDMALILPDVRVGLSWVTTMV